MYRKKCFLAEKCEARDIMAFASDTKNSPGSVVRGRGERDEAGELGRGVQGRQGPLYACTS